MKKQLVQNQKRRSVIKGIGATSLLAAGGWGFPAIAQAITPTAGKLILWENTNNGVIIPESSHAGEPVIKGEKFILTKRFREKEWPYSLPRK